MRRVEIDDEVYRWLEERVRGFEQPNAVLRRVLLGKEEANLDRDRFVRGSLWPLLEAGVISAGDELHHDQPRKGVTHRGVVERDGCLKTDKGSYRHTSRALTELTGTSISGPANWIHDRSGKTLNQLTEATRGRSS